MVLKGLLLSLHMNAFAHASHMGIVCISQSRGTHFTYVRQAKASVILCWQIRDSFKF